MKLKDNFQLVFYWPLLFCTVWFPLFAPVGGAGEKDRAAVSHESFLLMANSQTDMDDWVKAIRRVIWAPFGGGNTKPLTCNMTRHNHWNTVWYFLKCELCPVEQKRLGNSGIYSPNVTVCLFLMSIHSSYFSLFLESNRTWLLKCDQSLLSVIFTTVLVQIQSEACELLLDFCLQWHLVGGSRINLDKLFC